MNEKWKSAFDQIHAEEALKDHTKEYLSEKIHNRRSASHPVFRRAAVLAAGLVLLFFIGGTWIFMTLTIVFKPYRQLWYSFIIFIIYFFDEGVKFSVSMGKILL